MVLMITVLALAVTITVLLNIAYTVGSSKQNDSLIKNIDRYDKSRKA